LSRPELAPLEAWVATFDADQLKVSGWQLAAAALLHNDVLNAALATGRSPVPARFGSRFADDTACLEDLAHRRNQLVAVLDHVDGAVEIGVLVVPLGRLSGKPARPSRAEPGAGRRYLEAVRQQAREDASRQAVANAQAKCISEAVGQFVRGEVRTTDRRGIVSLAHLVSRDAVDDYRRVVSEMQPQREAKILLGEVRAPYSFAQLGEGGAGHDSSSPSNDD
jgi:hypothetical protein